MPRRCHSPSRRERRLPAVAVSLAGDGTASRGVACTLDRSGSRATCDASLVSEASRGTRGRAVDVAVAGTEAHVGLESGDENRVRDVRDGVSG